MSGCAVWVGGRMALDKMTTEIELDDRKRKRMMELSHSPRNNHSFAEAIQCQCKVKSRRCRIGLSHICEAFLAYYAKISKEIAIL